MQSFRRSTVGRYVGISRCMEFLLGLQKGYTKYCCILCLRYSRRTEKRYTVKEWPAREEFISGECNVMNEYT
jgi:hypothetical protein